MLIDLHTHTIASGHGTTDTVTQLAMAAAEKGLRFLGISDHAPAMAGAASVSYFTGLRFAPRSRFGISLLYGAELNILSEAGDVDLDDDILQTLDYAIVSLHFPIAADFGAEANTLAYIRAMDHPAVRIVGHPDDTRFPICPETLVLAAKQKQVWLEINNASLAPDGYRGDSASVDEKLLRLCAAFDVPVIIGSDSHGHQEIGDDRYARALMQKLSFPAHLIVNDCPALLASRLPKGISRI